MPRSSSVFLHKERRIQGNSFRYNKNCAFFTLCMFLGVGSHLYISNIIALKTVVEQYDIIERSVIIDDVNTWYPSDDWIHDCIRQESSEDLMQPYNVPWVYYRLGDCIRMCIDCEKSASASDLGNLSIAGQYGLHVCQTDKGSENLTFIAELFRQYEHASFPYSQPWEVPLNDTVIIHLRIGDVMDDPLYLKDGNITPFEMLRYGASTSHCIEGCDYHDGIKSIHAFLDLLASLNLPKVILRGGAHTVQPYPKSKIYTRCLINAFNAAGYSTFGSSINGAHNPDQDFFFMSHAKYFVQGTGGYSQLITDMVNRLGGKTITAAEKM